MFDDSVTASSCNHLQACQVISLAIFRSNALALRGQVDRDGLLPTLPKSVSVYMSPRLREPGFTYLSA